MIGTQDLILGALIVIVLFGARRLPELMGALGKSMKEFKKEIEGSTDEVGQSKSESPTTDTSRGPSDLRVLQGSLGGGVEPLPPVWRSHPTLTSGNGALFEPM